MFNGRNVSIIAITLLSSRNELLFISFYKKLCEHCGSLRLGLLTFTTILFLRVSLVLTVAHALCYCFPYPFLLFSSLLTTFHCSPRNSSLHYQNRKSASTSKIYYTKRCTNIGICTAFQKFEALPISALIRQLHTCGFLARNNTLLSVYTYLSQLSIYISSFLYLIWIGINFDFN